MYLSAKADQSSELILAAVGQLSRLLVARLPEQWPSRVHWPWHLAYPSLPAAQEKRDRVASGTYTKLYRIRTAWTVAEGLRVQPPAQLWEMIRETWGKPQLIVLR